MYFLKEWGAVRGFSTSYNKAVEEWNCMEKCRSFRVTNAGDEDITMKNGSALEIIEVGQSLTFGGYPDSFRTDVLSFSFAGGGTNPKLIIAQDKQYKEPILHGMFGKLVKLVERYC